MVFRILVRKNGRSVSQKRGESRCCTTRSIAVLRVKRVILSAKFLPRGIRIKVRPKLVYGVRRRSGKRDVYPADKSKNPAPLFVLPWFTTRFLPDRSSVITILLTKEKISLSLSSGRRSIDSFPLYILFETIRNVRILSSLRCLKRFHVWDQRLILLEQNHFRAKLNPSLLVMKLIPRNKAERKGKASARQHR